MLHRRFLVSFPKSCAELPPAAELHSPLPVLIHFQSCSENLPGIFFLYIYFFNAACQGDSNREGNSLIRLDSLQGISPSSEGRTAPRTLPVPCKKKGDLLSAQPENIKLHRVWKQQVNSDLYHSRDQQVPPASRLCYQPRYLCAHGLLKTLQSTK